MGLFQIRFQNNVLKYDLKSPGFLRLGPIWPILKPTLTSLSTVHISPSNKPYQWNPCNKHCFYLSLSDGISISAWNACMISFHSYLTITPLLEISTFIGTKHPRKHGSFCARENQKLLATRMTESSPSGLNTGIFKDHLSVYLGTPSQNELKSYYKKSQIFPIMCQSDPFWAWIWGPWLVI